MLKYSRHYGLYLLNVLFSTKTVSEQNKTAFFFYVLPMSSILFTYLNITMFNYEDGYNNMYFLTKKCHNKCTN